MASVLSEYLRLFDKFSEKYGGNVAVLMQVGSFYEMYGIDNSKERRGNAGELSRVLNIVLTRRSKKVHENGVNNPLMLGFPCAALSKYVPTLLAEDYTVVVVDQTKGPLGNIRRSVVDIVSPSVNIDDTASHSDSFLVLVYVDSRRSVGMSAISVTTGKSVVHECYSDANDPDGALDEALSFIKQYRPREAVLRGNATRDLVSYLELDEALCHILPLQGRPPSTEYQDSVLGLAFDNKDKMVSNIEHLGLERMPCALLSYTMLIEFVYDHNPMLLRRMSPPDIFSSLNRLVLSTSTVDQLDVAGPVSSRSPGTSSRGGKHTLVNVVNRCITNAGKRLLMRRILAPAVSAAEIELRYDQVDDFGALFGDDVARLLKGIVDIERLQRRMLVGIMTPSELANLTISYEAVLRLDTVVRKGRLGPSSLESTLMNTSDREALEGFIGMCRYAFDVESMLTSDAVFNEGVFEQLDDLKAQVQTEMDVISEFAMSIGIDSPRIENNSIMGHCIAVTASQAKIIKLSYKNRGIVIKQCASSSKVTSPKVEAASKSIVSLSEQLKARTRGLYRSTTECILSYSRMFYGIVKFVSEIDVTRSNLITSKLYNYCRPVVVHEGPSFVDAKGLRHPVLERVDNGVEYVPNDIAIGTEHNGIVLYSMNSCGKTTLLRALGLSVILAQAGCFVPASSFMFRPFRCIMTRVLSRDNIMKGQSSFVAEMAELRAILKRAVDGSTLVLADEITHGTEHTSGSSIFVSSVEALAGRGANFLLTTHLHNVYPLVKDLPNVRVCHLSVSFDSGKVLFERKLKEGPGGSMYGLEVCEFLGMDPEFVARAFQIRSMITLDKADRAIKAKPRPSRYNSKKMVQQCEGCGYSPKLPTDTPLHTHHVKHQSFADENMMINGVSKNALSNLRVLCKQCHSDEHTL